MNESIPDPQAALLAALDSGRTGCLVGVGADGARARVYVMLGAVLAAHADDDDARLLARLEASGALDARALDALRARATAAGALGDALFDVLPEPTVLGLLYGRFRENLGGFLHAVAVEAFEEMEAVFTDNIQVGHDSRALIAELVEAGARVAGLAAQPEMVLAPGALPAESELERSILARCVGRVRLRELLVRSPVEPSQTLGVVQDMLDRGMLLAMIPHPGGRADEDGPASARPGSAFGAELDEADGFGDGESGQVGAFGSGDPTDVPREAGSFDESLRRAFFQHAAGAEDGDLAAFQDYDSTRTGGDFSTERELLDRVDLDVTPAAAEADTELLLEMEEADAKEAAKSAVSLNFSGPKLSDDEVLRKLDVTSEVLATIADAIDVAEGRGAGQARLQILVEGTSTQLAPLFKSVELAADGRLPTRLVVTNLRKRPVAEHRRLLNRALTDLIERALSAAFESLDEPTLEAMLERIAGYQQRLGV